MRSLYFRIYLTVVAALALFALASGWLVQRHLEEQRVRVEASTALRDRAEAWGDLLERALPPADAPAAEQLSALREWSQRLRLPMALDDKQGQRVAVSDSFTRRDLANPANASRLQALHFDDGRKQHQQQHRQTQAVGPARRAVQPGRAAHVSTGTATGALRTHGAWPGHPQRAAVVEMQCLQS